VLDQYIFDSVLLGLLLGLLLVVILPVTLALWAVRRLLATGVAPGGTFALALPIVALAALGIISLGWFLVLWTSRVGAYVIPHLPGPAPDLLGPVTTDVLGALLCGVGLAATVLSLRDREQATATAVVSGLLLMLTVFNAFLYDNVTRSPYRVVRSFAVAASRHDQEAMNRLLSSTSLQELPGEMTTVVHDEHGQPRELVTVAFMHGRPARNTLLLDIALKGDRATMQVGVAYHWDATTFSGSGGRIYLVKEDGRWMVDAYREYRETLERIERDRED